ncbi:SapC family protein [Sphingomonas sp. BT-65]|uniref:SapC family protein n=1 Tax=Sphingomonas sp. BT-65 TaxID=2989821 RepID=UPI002235ED59|nr:SapC family protein [Sphingomonas sp. BT-65]MCW4462049.1 SapC family protein [Sphingomonas sp. BT-65]
MGNLEFLDPQAHANLRLDTRNAANRNFVQIVACEFLPAMHDYPILFTKNPGSGAFYAGAVMGLEPGQNLLANDGLLLGYRPADLVRQGFFLSDGKIAIDPDELVFAADGEPLFDAAGQPSETLKRVQQAMHTLHHGLPETSAIIDRFLAHRLIEPIDITLDFDDGGRLRLEGLYSVSLDSLHALPDDVALDLFRRGDLQIAYAQAASIQHIRRLARMRNDRLFAGLT